MGVIELDERTIGDAIRYLRYGAGGIRTYARGEIALDLNRRRVCSYGPHFPLFEHVPAGRGQRELFVLNGDSWRGPRSRTSSHQAITRRLVAETGAASIILPFSAIDGARIRVETIRPLAVREDTSWTTRDPLPDGAPDLDALETADRHVERDDRVYTDYRGETLETPHGTWRRDYVWNRGGHRYSRTIYRQSYDYRHAGGWRLASDWSEPTADHRYLDGRSLELDADGWHTTSHHHRLGDSVFSAIIDVAESRRFARPFEDSRATARETVTLVERDGRAYCEANEATRGHVAGPSAACVYCGVELFADSVWHRRSRYISSFDYNEPAPLYFLAELPRSADTSSVDTALESLAPRAVHAALARGRDVARQGDIFYVETAHTRESLAARGATFARLTLFTRDANPRKGELGYVPAARAEQRRRELAYARRRWRETFRAGVAGATKGERDYARPSSSAGSRKAWRAIRDSHARELAVANENLRRAIFASSAPKAGRYWNETRADAGRRQYRERIVAARHRVRDLETRGPRDSLNNTSRAHARDLYRTAYGTNALGYWHRAKLAAVDRFRPAANPASHTWRSRRERARRVLAIYGTAHSATEIATIAGATYARGIARHVPDLDTSRRGGRDHRDILLGDGETWYLAVRNTVPRQTRRRRHQPAAPRRVASS